MALLGESRLMLGTAQLGLDYGLANRLGPPDAAAGDAMLDAAWAHGVTAIDTARVYGDAEARIGRWRRRTGHRPAVVTKLPAGCTGDAVARHFGESLSALEVPDVAGLLVHQADDLADRSLLAALQALRDQGAVAAYGASVYTPDAARAALAVPGLGLLQVPISLFDTRVPESGVLDDAMRRGVMVMARSVLLQGLLTVDPAALPADLAVVAPALAGVRDLAAAAGCTPTALALAAVLAVPGVSLAVVGAESPDQIIDNAAAARRKLAPDLTAAAFALGRDLPEFAIDPRRWPDRLRIADTRRDAHGL